MSDSSKKRTLDAFFKPPPKKIRLSDQAVAGAENQRPLATSDEVS